MAINTRLLLLFFIITIFIGVLAAYQPLIAFATVLLFLALVFSLIKKINVVDYSVLIGVSIVVVFNLSDRIGVFLTLFLFFIFVLNLLLKREKLRLSKWLLIFAFWVTYSSFQIFWVEQTDRTIGHYQTLIFGTMLILLVTIFVNNKDKLVMMFKVFGIMMVVSSVFAWYEGMTGNYLNSSGVTHHNLEGIATVGFFNPNDYSMLLIVCMPLFFYWIKEYNFYYKMLAWFFIVTTFYVVYINESRSMLILFFFLLTFFMIELLRKNRFLVITIILVLGTTLSIFFNDIINEVLYWIRSIDSTDSSLNVRLYLLQSALDVFKVNIFGVGSGNIELYMPGQGNVHNLWIEILVNYGLIIFSLITIFFVVNIYRMFRYRKDSKIIYPVLLSVLIYIPACTVSSSAFQFNVFWFLMGLMISVTSVIRNQGLAKYRTSSLKQKQHVKPEFIS